MRHSIYICLLLVLGATMPALAQATKTITGTIVDDANTPLNGVNVLIKDTNRGTQTNFDGEYSIQAAAGERLEFTYTGFRTVIQAIGDRNVINMQMVEETSELGVVTITAQGIKREDRAIGYALTTVKGEDLSNRGTPDLARALQGKSPGVRITSTGGVSGSGTNIIIRGYSSISGGNQPLFIVDGVPFASDTNQLNSFVSSSNTASRIGDLDPNSIESVSILRGLSATALYGEEGKNGVILITTKSAASLGDYSLASESLIPKRHRNPANVWDYRLRDASTTSQIMDLYKAQRQVSTYSWDMYVDVADKLFAVGDKSSALKVINDMIAADSGNADLKRLAAFVFEANGMKSDAIGYYDAIITQQPDDLRAYRNMGLALASEGKRREAAGYLNRVVFRPTAERAQVDAMALEAVAGREYRYIYEPQTLILEGSSKITGADLRITAEVSNSDQPIMLEVIEPGRLSVDRTSPFGQNGSFLTTATVPAAGPEEFIAPDGIRGSYAVVLDYDPEASDLYSSPVFVKLTVSRNWGRTDQTDEVRLVELDPNRSRILVDSIRF